MADVTAIDDPATPADLQPVRRRMPKPRGQSTRLRGGLAGERDGGWCRVYLAVDGRMTLFEDEAMRLMGRVEMVDGRMSGK
jgi:hypothetical protein